jgi:hypothetical protein
MKLLETYYSAASMNQRAFLDVVRKLARDRDFLSGDDWKKVMMMGRDIAAEDILFADPVKDDDLADCASPEVLGGAIHSCRRRSLGPSWRLAGAGAGGGRVPFSLMFRRSSLAESALRIASS